MDGAGFDVVVVGAGPGGSTAAGVLANAGADVALVDRSEFPRDKVCGDLVGHRGLQALADIGCPVPPGNPAASTTVVPRRDRHIRLPLDHGWGHPAGASVIPRQVLDNAIFEFAVSEGATPVVGTVGRMLEDDGRYRGVELEDGTRLRADIVIGADGARTSIGRLTGLVDQDRTLKAYAVREYLPATADDPMIVLHRGGRSSGQFPGFGWVFPVDAEAANVGLGVGLAGGAARARQVAGHYHDFVDAMQSAGVVHDRGQPRVRGAWLKMGMVGSCPARGNVLLVGEAAGLTNPLTGEGIAEAILSGRLAAWTAISSRPSAVARAYRRAIAREFASFHQAAAALQVFILERPRAAVLLSEVITTHHLARLLAPSWSLFWNDLAGGAADGLARSGATAASELGRLLSRRSWIHRWFDETFGEDAVDPLGFEPAPTLSTAGRR
jgi:geranylgeranyl reductase family protein